MRVCFCAKLHYIGVKEKKKKEDSRGRPSKERVDEGRFNCQIIQSFEIHCAQSF